VDWPVYSLDELMKQAAREDGGLERVCISMVMHPAAVEDTTELIEILASELSLPISVLVNPSSIEDGDLQTFHDAGADMATVAIDTATNDLFEEYRGNGVGGPHDWDEYWGVLSDTAMVFGKEKFGCHLITGLGETEQEMVDTIQRVRDIGGRSHMFSFFPEQGSLLMYAEACNVSQYRRVQLARFLIDYDMSRSDRMEFDDQGRIVSFGMKGRALDEAVESGRPFMTSGCPGESEQCACNRPYGDGPPGDIRSYPFPLDENDLQLIRRQMAIYSETVASIKTR